MYSQIQTFVHFKSSPTQQPARTSDKSDHVPPLLTNTGPPFSLVSVWSTPIHAPQVSLPAIVSWKPALICPGAVPKICLVSLSLPRGLKVLFSQGLLHRGAQPGTWPRAGARYACDMTT